MESDSVVVIRAYQPADRDAVRQISCQTALMGEPSAVFFDDDEVFADALTLYFTDYEPESCFVAECDGRVVGYLLGARDVKRMDQIMRKKIAPGLLMKALRRGTLLRGKNLRFLFHVCLSLIKGEFRSPSFSQDYPGALHINLAAAYRAQGTGSALIQANLAHLRAQGSRGVHFATMSEKASIFFKKQGFQLLFQGKRSYLRYLLGHDTTIYIYGMRLVP